MTAAKTKLSSSSRRNHTKTSQEDNKEPTTKKRGHQNDNDKKLSKRQRRKLERSQNTVKPTIAAHSVESRERKYLLQAGLHSRQRDKVHTEAKEQQQQRLSSSTISSSSSKDPIHAFAKCLGSADPKTRHMAVVRLQNYLQAKSDIVETHNDDDDDDDDNHHHPTGKNHGFSELDLLKLWKALWHTLYMADHVVVQQELCKEMAKLLWCLAGTQEQDEYAGQAYLRYVEDIQEEMMRQEEMEKAEEGQTMDDEVDDNDHDDDDDEEDDFIMEEVANTLNEGRDDNDEDDEDESDLDQKSSDDEDGGYSTVQHCRGAHLASLFVRTCLQTIRREWGSMDKYRTDKFYSLLRHVYRQVFLYMAERHWNLGIIRLFHDAIYEEALSQVPNGLRYHLIDIVLDELVAVAAGKDPAVPMPLTEATFLDCLEPYFALAQTGGAGVDGIGGDTIGDDSVQQRVVNNVLLKFLNEYSVVRKVDENSAGHSNESGDRSSQKGLVLDQVHVGTVAQFIFEIASDASSTKDKYRKSLYDVHKLYVRQLKKVGKDVELDNNDSDEDETGLDEDWEESGADSFPVDKATPEENRDVNDGDRGKPKKKKKKKKKDKKKSKKADTNHHENNDGLESDSVSDQEAKKVSRVPPSNDGQQTRKRKKKEKRSNTAGDVRKEEEEITITLEDQRAAKKDMRRKSDHELLSILETPFKKKKAKGPKSELTSSEKKVKFKNANKARSWKASMNGLRTTKPPDVSTCSPEKGILLNKDAVIKRTPMGKRRKAVDYF